MPRDHRTEHRLARRRRNAGEKEDAEEKEDRQDKIHERAGKDDDHACRNRLRAVAALTRRIVRGIHARDIVEAAQRKRTQRVFRLAVRVLDDSRPEADREAVDAHICELRRHEMPDLMHEDEDAEDENGCKKRYDHLNLLFPAGSPAPRAALHHRRRRDRPASASSARRTSPSCAR